MTKRSKNKSNFKKGSVEMLLPTLTVEKKQKRCKACKYRTDSVFKVYM